MKENHLQFSLAFLLFSLIPFFPGPALAVTVSGPHFSYSVEILPFDAKEKGKYHLNIIQPYSFALATIQRCMTSLAYQKKMVAWSKKKRVFSNAVILRMAPLIAKSFTRAGPNQRVVFKIIKSTGRTLLMGDTFLSSEGMHWRITNVKHSQRRVDDFSIMGDSWRLVPRKGQKYKTKQPYKHVVQNVTNWIIFPRIRPVASKVLEPPPPVAAAKEEKKIPVTSESGIKERLKILEDLKQEGLINEEEYQTKRRKILRDL